MSHQLFPSDLLVPMMPLFGGGGGDTFCTSKRASRAYADKPGPASAFPFAQTRAQAQTLKNTPKKRQQQLDRSTAVCTCK
ncbi:conserved hypothetical protein [Ricinus communis]|uniref:Uncharacterized protein n=1 Tax=Ricinus communis TaxID=3988 RepID=B9RCL6_RICCO|nr:conserved hypothetical protein [Ricinus communis]